MLQYVATGGIGIEGLSSAIPIKEETVKRRRGQEGSEVGGGSSCDWWRIGGREGWETAHRGPYPPVRLKWWRSSPARIFQKSGGSITAQVGMALQSWCSEGREDMRVRDGDAGARLGFPPVV